MIKIYNLKLIQLQCLIAKMTHNRSLQTLETSLSRKSACTLTHTVLYTILTAIFQTNTSHMAVLRLTHIYLPPEFNNPTPYNQSPPSSNQSVIDIPHVHTISVYPPFMIRRLTGSNHNCFLHFLSFFPCKPACHSDHVHTSSNYLCHMLQFHWPGFATIHHRTDDN